VLVFSNLSVELLDELGVPTTPARVEPLAQPFVGPDRTPKFNATWSGSALLTTLVLLQDQVFRLVLPQASCSISRAELSLHSS